MRLIIAVLMGILIVHPGRAQEVADSTMALAGADSVFIPVIAYWALGDEAMYEITQGKRKSANGVITEADSSVSMYRFTVTDSTATSYTFNWIPVDFEMPELDAEVTKHLDALMGYQVLIETDELGAYKGLQKADTLRHALEGVMAAAFREIAANATSEINPEAEALLRSMMSPDLVIAKMTEPLQRMLAMHGYEYHVGEVITYEDVLPNLLGGDPIPALGTLEITQVDYEQGVFTARQTLTADAKAMTGLVKQILSAAQGEDNEGVLERMQMEMVDETVYVIDYFYGWVLSLDHTRIVDALDTQQGTQNRQETVLQVRLTE